MDYNRESELLDKYLRGECTAAEKQLVERAFLRMPRGEMPRHDEAYYQQLAGNTWQQFQQRIRRKRIRRLRIRVITAAAAILLAMSASLYFSVFNMDRPQEIAAADIPPGTNRATLTLADGRTIDLSEAHTGIVVGEEVVYNDGSEVLAAGKERLSADVSSLMSVSTPKGGTYQVTLPDGSKVWLNSASTLNYPSRFSGEERVVELIGEAYFDVAKAKSKNAQKQAWPFRVVSKGQQVEVLGTQFNISAYPDEPITKTTLVEGSVAIRPHGASASWRIVPGEQGQVVDGAIEVDRVDVEKYTAWKDGYFKFDGTLRSIMAQVSRWYDVEVAFGPGVDSSMELMGQISRDKKLSDILWMINEIDSSLKFKIELIDTDAGRESANQHERRLTVMR